MKKFYKISSSFEKRESNIHRKQTKKFKFSFRSFVYQLAIKANTDDILSNIDHFVNTLNLRLTVKPSHAKQKNSTLSIVTDEMDNFVFPVHYSNGLVEIYNLLDEPIYVNKLLTSDNEIMVNKVVPASQRKFEFYKN